MVHLCYNSLDKYSTGDTEQSEVNILCINPLKGWKDKNGRVVAVTRSDVVAVDWSEARGYYNKIYNANAIKPDSLTQYIDIPCRSCNECFNQTRREWITRAVCESKLHDAMLFCTFTYEDDKIPKSEVVTCDGEILVHNTLRYRDFQLFMKKLRKQLNHPIRYMVCGEYGSKTFRPHYHAIMYGLSFNDFKSTPEFYKTNSNGDILFTIKDLTETWEHGYVVVSAANTQTMAYVAGYVAKKLTTSEEKDMYDECGIVRPFIKSSKALGAVYFDSIIDKFDNIYDYTSVSTDSDPFKVYLTTNWKLKFEKRKVYKKMLDKGLINDLDHDKIYKDKTEYYNNKVARRVALLDNREKLLQTDMSKNDRNSSKKTDFRNSCKRKRGIY